MINNSFIKSKNLYFYILVLIILSSCKYSRLLKSDNTSLKYDTAIMFYEKKNYPKAILFFESVLPIIRGEKRAEKASFLYAKSHYFLKRYIESASYFQTFVSTYSRSPYAEEAYFLACKSLYNQSSGTELDQTATEIALSSSITFVNRNPDSPYKEEVYKMIEVSRARLEKKDFDNTKLYYKLKDYNPNTILSTIITAENFEIEHPESNKMEDIKFLKLQARFDLAEISSIKKKMNRYLVAKDEYLIFIEDYPKSKHLKKAEKIYQKTLTAIEKINKYQL